jgi:hypothetical protein
VLVVGMGPSRIGGAWLAVLVATTACGSNTTRSGPASGGDGGSVQAGGGGTSSSSFGGTPEPCGDDASGWREVPLPAADYSFGSSFAWSGRYLAIMPPVQLDHVARLVLYDARNEAWLLSNEGEASSERGGVGLVWDGERNRVVALGGGSKDGPYDGLYYDLAYDAWGKVWPTNLPYPPGRRTMHAAGAHAVIAGGLPKSTISFARTLWIEAQGWSDVVGDGAPDISHGFATLWTGEVLLFVGGHKADYGGAATEVGALDPITHHWVPVSADGAPSHTGAVPPATAWTTSEAFVWSGVPPQAGALYDPVANSWRPVTPGGAPTPGRPFAAYGDGRVLLLAGSAGLYDPVEDAWSPVDSGLLDAGFRTVGVAFDGCRFAVWGYPDEFGADPTLWTYTAP